MYELRRLFKRHIEENFSKYILILFLFFAGVLAGFLFSKGGSSENYDSLNGEVGTFMDEFSEGHFSRGEIAKTSLVKNFRIIFLIFISGLSVWLSPALFGVLFSYGFSLGFTLSYLSGNFGFQGFGVAITSVIFAFAVNIPVYITLAVVAFNNSRHKRRLRNSEGNFGLYTMIFALMFVFSSISVIFDTFLIPWIISLICSWIYTQITTYSVNKNNVKIPKKIFKKTLYKSKKM